MSHASSGNPSGRGSTVPPPRLLQSPPAGGAAAAARDESAACSRKSSSAGRGSRHGCAPALSSSDDEAARRQPMKPAQLCKACGAVRRGQVQRGPAARHDIDAPGPRLRSLAYVDRTHGVAPRSAMPQRLPTGASLAKRGCSRQHRSAGVRPWASRLSRSSGAAPSSGATANACETGRIDARSVLAGARLPGTEGQAGWAGA
eukprot:COSAG01_NODE_5618_length_4143_cov_1.881553_2_plen_202_part_00